MAKRRLLTPLKAIREQCLKDCMGGSAYEVRHCSRTTCSLWPYRFGKRVDDIIKRAFETQEPLLIRQTYHMLAKDEIVGSRGSTSELGAQSDEEIGGA